MKFDKIKPGMTLYDVHHYRMGNTRMRSLGVWQVLVHTVNADQRMAIVSWNGNPAEVYYEHELEKLKAERPVLIRNHFGQYRRETKDEKAARLAKAGPPSKPSKPTKKGTNSGK